MSNIACNKTNGISTPWAGFRDLEQQLERVFNGAAVPGKTGPWTPAVDIYETDDAYILQADLPGLNKDDIDLHILNEQVTLRGARNRAEQKDGKGYWRFERPEGKFERSFRVRGGVDADKVEARFENGVLTVSLPKPEAAKPRQIEVKIN